MQTRSFRAMGTDVEILLQAPSSADADAALAAAALRIDGLEQRLSRFRADSELSTLNRTGHARVGDDLLAVTRMALAARADTGGRFDPTVLRAVVAAGYDRSFEDLPADRPDAARGTPHGCGGAVTVDGASRTVALEPGTELDLGGIAKGYTAEVVADELHSLGPCLVNVGGDIATRGVPDEGVWSVGVQTADETIAIGIAGGGLATSGRDRRVWRVAGEERHHVIDPATAQTARTDVLRVTVVAESAVRAETLATALFLAGAEEAVREAARRNVTAIVVTDDGRTLMTENLT
jgi:thiamine biosynthesis lipoprotein